ncbi:MAG: hypothetical protein NZM06_09285 [Chloroherpetonaceae bacterium]|nr:hypothetical protein [Chloroherpetonaceae bacterium]MDW8437311.1 hypothetical protein [Chloroherpetonaceae bacterium]
MRFLIGLILVATVSASSLLAQFREQKQGTTFFPQASATSRPEPKSAFVGAALSFLLPGLGELYAGNFETGRYFLGAEVAMWLGIGAQRLRGASFESDYKVLARRNAGVSDGEKDAQFWKDISAFNSIEEFNADRLRARDFGRLYDPQTHFWQWNSEANRRQFRDLRIRSDEAYQSIYYFIAAMGVNRVLSMINAARGVNAYNETNSFSKQDEAETSLYFLPEHRSLCPLPDGIRVEFQASF